MAKGRRGFGSVRRLQSGRWQVRYLGPDGKSRAAPTTFSTKADAGRYLAGVQTDMTTGRWFDPDAGKVALKPYADAYLESRTDLSPRTLETYRESLRVHITPELGSVQLADITPELIRVWFGRLSTRTGPTQARKTYAFLRSLLNVAVRDSTLSANPCRIPGAGTARATERPLPTLPQVQAVLDELPERYHALVHLAVWSHARLGELLALTRDRIDLNAGCVRYDRQVVTTDDGRMQVTEPKTAAGVRTVALPPHVRPLVQQHLDRFAGPILVFPGADGALLSRWSFAWHWKRARQRAGAPGLHFHDLRHLGLTLAAVAGATTRELMKRAGHSSARAALIYQHASEDRDAVIAAALSELADASPKAIAPRQHQ
jgi:integrase